MARSASLGLPQRTNTPGEHRPKPRSCILQALSGDHTNPALKYPLPCVGCGYDLVGLPEDGLCPECGVAIGRSISGDHLLASASEHRRLLARGARCAHVGAIVGWAALAAAAVAYALSASIPLASWFALLPLCAAMALTGWGWADLTREDPDGVGLNEPADAGPMIALRLWAYLSIGVAICAATVGTTMLLLGQHVMQALMALSITTGAIFTGAALSLSQAMASQVGRCARRLLEGELAYRAGGLAPAGYAALALGGLALLLTLAPLGGWWWLLRPLAWTACAIALLAWGVIYHAVLRALATALSAIAPRQGRPHS